MVGASREAKHSKCHHPRDLSPHDVRVIPNRSRGGGCHSPGACHGKRLRSEGACPWRLPAWDGAPTAEFGQTRACRGHVCLGGGEPAAEGPGSLLCSPPPHRCGGQNRTSLGWHPQSWHLLAQAAAGGQGGHQPGRERPRGGVAAPSQDLRAEWLGQAMCGIAWGQATGEESPPEALRGCRGPPPDPPPRDAGPGSQARGSPQLSPSIAPLKESGKGSPPFI